VEDDPACYVDAMDFKNWTGKTITVLAYHITHKPVRTIRGETMSFGTFIDRHMNWIDTVHFPEIHKKVAPQAGFFRITGKVIEKWGVYSLEVTDIEKASIRKRMPGNL
jgi:DNA polymerase-3 subunit alpha